MFPLLGDVLKAFQTLKSHFENSVVTAIDEDLPLVVETDASNLAIEAMLYRVSRPAAFFSRTLSKGELNHSAEERKTYSVIEAIRDGGII